MLLDLYLNNLKQFNCTGSGDDDVFDTNLQTAVKRILMEEAPDQGVSVQG